MIRAGALLLLLATVAVGASGCVLAPVPVGPPVVVGPRPVVVVPSRPHYHYHGGGYYRGGYHRGYGHRWR
jgi:hypothetical protein